MAKRTAAIDNNLFEAPTLEEFEINQFFDEVAPGVSVIHFHRMHPDGRRPQIGKALLDVIKEDVYDYIRTTFMPKHGAGKYLLIARGDGGKFMGSRIIEVDGTETSMNNPNTVGSSSAPGTPENLSFHDKLLLYNFIGSQKQQIDIGAIMAGMASMMVAMRPAETSKPLDPLAMFQAMMEMYKSNKPVEKNSLNEIREVAAVIKEFSGDSKDVDSMWGAVSSIGKDAIDKLAPVLGAVAGVRPAAPGPAVIASRPIQQIPAPQRVSAIPQNAVIAGATPTAAVVPPIPADGPAEEITDVEANLKRWLAVQIGFFKEKCAKKNKDPEFWADYLFENEEEPGCSAVLYAMRQGATLENLLAFDTEIGQNPQLTWWFSQLYDHVKTGLQSDLDTGGPAGHLGNDPGDETASASRPQRAGSNGTGRVVPDTDIH